MYSTDPRKNTNPGHEGHGVYLCSRCGWPFPNAHPSAKHRRAHKRVCGTVEGYIIEVDSGAASLSHSYSQHSAISSFSDDEHGSDGDSKAPSVKGVISRSVSQGGIGRVLTRSGTSVDDVFSDAVSEFVDASLADEELLLAVNTKSVPHNSAPSFTAPSENVTVGGGRVQASISRENSSESLPNETTTSPVLEEATSFSELPVKVDDAMTDTSEENKRSNASEEPVWLETGFIKINDASEVIVAPAVVLVGKDDVENSEVVTEESTCKDPIVAESEICQNVEKLDVKSDSETFLDYHPQEDVTLLRSSEEISAKKVEGNTQIKNDEILTESAAESSACTSPAIYEVVDVSSTPKSNNAELVNNQLVVEPSCEVEGDISDSISADDGLGALHVAAKNETLEMSLVHTESGQASEDSAESYLNSSTRPSANDDTGSISTIKLNCREGSIGGNGTVNPEDGLDDIGIIAENSVAKAEGNTENETKSDNLSLDIRSEEHVSLSPVVPVQSVEIASEAAFNQLEGIIESVFTERDLQVSSDANASLGDGSIENATVMSKEVKPNDAEGPVPDIDTKSVSHDVLLEKLEEDLSDGEPVESLPATESSSQSLGNNQVGDGGDSSAKDNERSQDPEKDTAILVADAPFEISSTNGSSLDGNWGSVSVLSTMSDAAGDVKKPKEAQQVQYSDKYDDAFDPPSFMTLIEPQALKTSSEVQNPQHSDAAKAAWFSSNTNTPNDSNGRKKNEEIIAKVTNWSTGKQNSPLKTLLSEAKGKSPISNPSAPASKENIAVKNGTPVPTLNSILGSEEPNHIKNKLDSTSKDWSPRGRYPDEIKREKRKVKGRLYWVPFMCCSSVK